MLRYTSLSQHGAQRAGYRISASPPPPATPRFEIHTEPFLSPSSPPSHGPSSWPAAGEDPRLRPPHRSGLPSAADLPGMFAAAVKLSSGFFHPGVQGNNLEPGAAPAGPRPADRAALMKAYGRAGKPEEALRLLRQMRATSPPPRGGVKGAALCYNTALNAVVENGGGPLDAAAVLDQMDAAGVPMDVSTHNILLKVSFFSLHFARRMFDSMSKRGCRPDEITYSTLILHLARAGRIDHAYRVLEQILREGCPPNVYNYTPILHALCIRGRVGEAKTLMKVMEESGCLPNTVAHNILIAGLCKVRDFSGVEKILGESTMKGWRPSVITYNTYMDGLCKAGRTREAFAQLDIMVGSGLCPSAVTISILLDCLCRNLDLRNAKDLLEKSHQLEWDASVVDYNTVMSAFCECKEWALVVNFLAGMLKKGVVPNTTTYNIAIYSLCKAGKLDKAKHIKNNGVVAANVVTYNILIDGFLGTGAKSDVEDLLKSMLEENIQHDLFTYTIRIAYLCKEGKVCDACHLFRTLKRRLSPDLVLYSTLICGLVRNGYCSTGRQLLKDMLVKGLSPNAPVFDSINKGILPKRLLSNWGHLYYCRGNASKVTFFLPQAILTSAGSSSSLLGLLNL